MVFLSFKKSVDDIMIKIIKQEIKISHEFKSKVEWACKYNSTRPIFINSSLLKLEPTNIGYIELHRAIINKKTYLLFNGHEFVYYRDLNTKIKLSDLKDFIKNLESHKKRRCFKIIYFLTSSIF